MGDEADRCTEEWELDVWPDDPAYQGRAYAAGKARCPYCNRQAKYRESSACVYNGVDYGPIYHCKAWVGCHRGTKKPLGRLANAELREWKQMAHLYFDKAGACTRQQAYRALGTVLGIRQNDCHIGMMDVLDCERVVVACQYGLVEDVLRGLS